LDRRRVTGVHLPDRPGAAVLAATFFHGSFNAVGSLSLVYLTGAGNLLTAAVGVAGIGAAVVAEYRALQAIAAEAGSGLIAALQAMLREDAAETPDQPET
jgi:hypothetical protein